MSAQVFADEELERLREFPEIGRDDLVRFFTLTEADMAFVDPVRGRGPAARLGLSLTLCTLPWLGFVPLWRTSHGWRRQCEGLVPKRRRKARLNAASEV